MKSNDTLKGIMVAIGLGILFFGLALGGLAITALGVQYVALTFFAEQIGFWPCVVFLLVLGAIASIIRGNTTK